MLPSYSGIRRVLTHLRPDDPPEDARRAGRLISDLDWQTPGLAADAILCVRQMRLPLPRGCVAPEPVARWRHAAQSDVWVNLSRFARDAGRPAHGLVPAGTNAVLFVDTAELLLCLALDWSAGDARSCWWWQALFPGVDLTGAMQRTWREHPMLIPLMLAQLEARGQSGRLLDRLGSNELDWMWSALVQAFDLPQLADAWSDYPSRRDGETESRSDVIASESASVPWLPWVQLPEAMSEPARRLLVVSLMLQRAPAVARSNAFARNLREWRKAFRPSIKATISSPHAKHTAFDSNAPLPEARSKTLPSEPQETTEARATAQWQASKDRPASREETSPEIDRKIRPPSLPSDASISNMPPGETRSSEMGSSPIFVPPQIDGISVADEVLPPVITGHGGIFYLTNVALALGYYGDFTMPAQPGLALPVWDFLALVGRRFAGPLFDADPLAGLLAQLSCRPPDEPPGKAFEPADGKPLEVWLDETESAVHERLVAAFGDRTREELVALVCNRAATVRTSRTRVDVTFVLGDHLIELRLAGLDRDPGWVPAGGRTLTFHYE